MCLSQSWQLFVIQFGVLHIAHYFNLSATLFQPSLSHLHWFMSQFQNVCLNEVIVFRFNHLYNPILDFKMDINIPDEFQRQMHKVDLSFLYDKDWMKLIIKAERNRKYVPRYVKFIMIFLIAFKDGNLNLVYRRVVVEVLQLSTGHSKCLPL